METFISDYSLIEEKISEVDYFDFKKDCDNLSARIDKVETTALIGLVAGFGRGKSSLIRQVQKLRPGNTNELWVDFDAWDMPDRLGLWEGFVLALAKAIDPKCLEKTIKKIDGTQNDDKKAFLNTISDVQVFGCTLGPIRNLSHFIETSPAKRVADIQVILLDLINRTCKQEKIIITAEDTDRSGPNGIFFIETLRSFLKGHVFIKKLVILIPIAEETFYREEEAYLKCLDIVDFLQPQDWSLKRFFKKVLVSNVLDKDVDLIADFFGYQMRQHPNTTLRKIKLILRKALVDYKAQRDANLDPDWRITIMFAAAKFFKSDQGVSEHTGFRVNESIAENSIFGAFLSVIYDEQQRIGKSLLNGEGHPNFRFSFGLSGNVPRLGIPYEDILGNRHWLSKLYLNY